MRVRTKSFGKTAVVAILAATAALGGRASCPPDTVMRVGKIQASADDWEAVMAGASADSAAVASFADYLRILSEAYELGMVECPPGTPDPQRRIAEGVAVFDLTESRTTSVAESDSAGREAFFDSHRRDFQWERPRFRGSILLAEDDATARTKASELRETIDEKDDAAAVGRKCLARFGKAVRVVTVDVASGENPFVDFAVFAAGRPEPVLQWKSAAVVRGIVLTGPRSAQDVLPAAVRGYSAELRERWLRELREKYPAETAPDIRVRVGR